jgi:hypothetical protein
VVKPLLGWQVTDAIGQGVPDHTLLILNRPVLVNVIVADFGTRDCPCRPNA